MKNRIFIKTLSLLLLSLLLTLGFFAATPREAIAAENSFADGKVTIDTFATAQLGASITAVQKKFVLSHNKIDLEGKA